MSSGPGSWVASMVGLALAVLVACLALSLAADYLRRALPVLVPAAVVVLISVGLWHWYSRPRGW